MKRNLFKAAAVITLLMMVVTVMVPSVNTAQAASDGGQTEVLERGKLRVLEVYPHDMSRETEDIKKMDMQTQLDNKNKDKYIINTISINELISLKEEINGNYDIVYFNNGNYRRNATTEHSYGSDITNLKADELEEFIQAGQLCIFHEGVFTNNKDNTYNTILKQRFAKYQNNPSYKNVIVVKDKDNNDKSKDKESVINSMDTLYKDTAKGMNQRPILVVTESPAAYSASNTNHVDNKLTFSFKVYDPETPLDESLMVSLYIDRNNDSLYSEKEIIYPQLDSATGEYYTIKVKNGQSGTITFNMPQGLTGVYFWKLVVKDAKNAKSEVSNVFKLKGNEIVVKVLQIKPDNGGNLSLSTQFNKQAEGFSHKYGSKNGEYKIEVTEMTVKEFNKAAYEGKLQLNGVYDMIILGFNDNYTDTQKMEENGAKKYEGALGQKAVDAIRAFVDTQQSVMFTHDTIHFYKNALLTQEFAKDVGQVFVTQSNVGSNGTNFAGIWTAGLAGSNLKDWNQSDARTRINLFDPQINKNAQYPDNTRHYQVINTWPDLGHYVNPVNSSALTLYPFVIEGGKYDNYTERKVASTHYQWYKLDLEDPEVIPLFNLYVDGKGKFNDDAMNNYYTYTRKNITYSGTGHKTDSKEVYPDFETKLFVNTAIRAYSIANHAPELTIYEPQNNDKISKSASAVTLKFRAYDFDLGDDILKYSIYVSKNNDDNYVPVAELVEMSNGSVITTDISSTYMPDVGKFKIKVTAEDPQKAMSSQEITLERVDKTIITPSIKITDTSGNPVSGVLVNEKVNAKVTFEVTGKTSPQTTLNPKYDLTGSYLAEPEKTFANNADVGAVTFYPSAAPSPATIVKEYNDIKIDPVTTGDTTFQMTAKLREIPGYIESKTVSDSVNVRTGQVKISVEDIDGNPIKNVTVKDLGGPGTWTTNDSGYAYIEKVAGTKDFDIVVPTGYMLDSETIYKLNSSGNRIGTATEVKLTYDDYSWEIVYKIKLSINASVKYYKLNPSKTAATVIGPAGAEYTATNLKNTSAYILAKVSVDPLAAGRLTEMEFTLETEKGGVIISSGDYAAKVYGTSVNVTGVTGATELNALSPSKQIVNAVKTVPSTESMAGQDFYLIIVVPKTDGQTIRLTEVKMTTMMTTPSGEVTLPPRTVSIDNKGITFIEPPTPMLR